MHIPLSTGKGTVTPTEHHGLRPISMYQNRNIHPSLISDFEICCLFVESLIQVSNYGSVPPIPSLTTSSASILATGEFVIQKYNLLIFYQFFYCAEKKPGRLPTNRRFTIIAGSFTIIW